LLTNPDVKALSHSIESMILSFFFYSLLIHVPPDTLLWLEYKALPPSQNAHVLKAWLPVDGLLGSD
jgi:hypothetical protein